ncbi:MAG: bifunctional hydroxymethylpyrimidine kinase/phosphomethylpyrimidine kinase [Phycisphaerales bacterium]|nr:MAG: bifunctional hydroxymethylpyrimidine kinase/phosphomethylpyrimidine kinase [Phycisphaerales bacterium]
MSLLVTGSIGIDTVKTPYGVSKDCLGGSVVYFSMAASLFSPVRFIGVIGSDCPFDLAEVFAGKDVDLTGLEVRENSKTFRWTGTYSDNMDDRRTDHVELNVLAEAPPKVPEAFKDSKFLFLANTAPALQHELLEQVDEPVFVAADTMDLWVREQRGDLETLLKRINCLVINEDEARMLADDHNLARAAKKMLYMGPSVVVIKKGASGSMMCNTDGETFILPAYPAVDVRDPTGAGDCFAGGFMGYLANRGSTDFATLKTAVAYGTVVSSFSIADFSLSGLTLTKRRSVDKRLEMLRNMTRF